MAGFWDQFGRSAVSSMQQSAPLGAEIFRDKQRKAEAAQRAEMDRILQVMGFMKGVQPGQRGAFKGLDTKAFPHLTPAYETLLNEKPGINSDVIGKRLAAFSGLSQKERAATLKQMREMGEDKTLGDWFSVFDLTSRAPDKKDFQVMDGALLAPNPETGDMEVVYSAPKGLKVIGVNKETNTFSVFDEDKREIIKIPLGDYVKEEVSGGNLVKSRVGAGGTTIDEIELTPAEELSRYRWKEKVDAEIAKMTEPSADKNKMNATAEKELRQVTMVKDTANQLLGMLNDPTVGPQIKKYLGGGSAWWRRALSSESSNFMLRTPTDVVKFTAMLEHARDIITRKQTGAALNKSEEVFYETLIGGMGLAPETLTARLETLIDQMDKNTELIMQGSGGATSEGALSDDEIKRRALDGDEEAIRIARERGFLTPR